MLLSNHSFAKIALSCLASALTLAALSSSASAMTSSWGIVEELGGGEVRDMGGWLKVSSLSATGVTGVLTHSFLSVALAELEITRLSEYGSIDVFAAYYDGENRMVGLQHLASDPTNPKLTLLASDFFPSLDAVKMKIAISLFGGAQVALRDVTMLAGTPAMPEPTSAVLWLAGAGIAAVALRRRPKA